MRFVKVSRAAAASILLLSTVACGSREAVQNPEIIGHRGAAAVAPENTMAAVQAGWDSGADAVEVDVHLSSDGRVMVIHDETAARTAGQELAIESSDSAELRSLDAGSWKGSQFAGERIPFIEEVIDSIPPGKRLYIEIKCASTIVPHLASIIGKSGKASQIVLISFHSNVLLDCKKAMPEIEARWIIDAEWDDAEQRAKPIHPQWVREAKKKGFDGLNVNWEGVDERFVAAALEEDMTIAVWTCNDPAEARRLLALGVEGITTDDPDAMVKAFHAK